MRSYKVENIDDTLNFVTESFIHQEIEVNHNSEKLIMSQIFDWYRKDFANDFKGVLM